MRIQPWLSYSQNTIDFDRFDSIDSFVDAKVFTPHYALIDTELFTLVINPASEDAFPTGRFVGQELWTEQRVENDESVLSIIIGLRGFSNGLRESTILPLPKRVRNPAVARRSSIATINSAKNGLVMSDTLRPTAWECCLRKLAAQR